MSAPVFGILQRIYRNLRREYVVAADTEIRRGNFGLLVDSLLIAFIAELALRRHPARLIRAEAVRKDIGPVIRHVLVRALRFRRFAAVNEIIP